MRAFASGKLNEDNNDNLPATFELRDGAISTKKSEPFSVERRIGPQATLTDVVELKAATDCRKAAAMAPVFFIPEYLEELEGPLDDQDRLVCQELVAIEDLSPEQVDDLVKGVTYELSEREVVSIEDQDLFDQVYSIVRAFGSLKPVTKSRLAESLCSNLAVLIASITPLVSSGCDSEAASWMQSIRSTRNALKIYVYFIQHMIAPQDSDRRSAVQRAAKGTKGKGRKPRQKDVPQEWDREIVQTRFVRLVAAAAVARLQQLFGTGQPEEAFIALIAKLAFAVLESPTVAKDGDLKEALYSIVTACASKYGYLDQSVASIMHLLHRFDNLPVHLAELVALSKERHGDTNFAVAVIREIGQTSPKEYSRDTVGAENVGLFLIELTNKLPKLLCTNLSFIMSHMDGDSYKIRNALVQIMGVVIAKAFGDPNENIPVEPAPFRTRQVLLDMLLERTRDISAYTRTKVLQTWAGLCQQGAISIGHWNLVADIAAGRLEDKSAFVRKSALQLLATLLQFNPFGPQLRSAAFEATLEKYKKQLADMTSSAPDSNSSTPSVPDPAPEVSNSKSGVTENSGISQVENGIALDDDSLCPSSQDTEPPSRQAATSVGTPVRLDVGGLEQTRALVASLEAGLHFAKCMASTMPILTQLLASKTIGDVDQTIQLLICCKQFQVDGSADAVHKILPLVFSQDKSIQQAVEDAFFTLYVKRSPSETALNLINLTLEASLGDLASVEALVVNFMGKGEISQSTVSRLWDIFRFNGVTGVTAEQSRGALGILCMAAKTCPNILSSNLQSILDIGFGRRAKEDVLLARFACIALQRLSDEDREKLGHSHKVFNVLSSVITTGGLSEAVWYSMAEQAINAIYLLHPTPEAFVADLVLSFSKSVFSGAKNRPEAQCGSDDGDSVEPKSTDEQDYCYLSESAVSRFFFVVAHVALKQLVYVESCLRNLRKQKADKDREAPEVHGGQTDEGSTTPKGGGISEELGLVASEDARLDEIFEKAEREIVSGGDSDKTLISTVAPVVSKLCRKFARLPERRQLRSSSMLALCKLMAVDAKFCEQNLQFLFTVAQVATEETLRSNCVIALGDLSMRFPNLLEPWTESVYARLHDGSALVRKNAVLVLAHLILNDMMKVKGHITELALHFEDEDERVANLVRLFFHELSKKSNSPIYNLLPDMISRMSSMANLPREQFQNIMQFFIGFIEKDKQTEGLVDKLCNRFPGTSNAKQWRDIAYCLSELKCTEKGTKKLMDMFKLYEPALVEAEVVEHVEALISKAKKFANPELKVVYDDFVEKIQRCHKERMEQENAYRSANRFGTSSKQIPGQSNSQVPKNETEDYEAHEEQEIKKSPDPGQITELSNTVERNSQQQTNSCGSLGPETSSRSNQSGLFVDDDETTSIHLNNQGTMEASSSLNEAEDQSEKLVVSGDKESSISSDSSTSSDEVQGVDEHPTSMEHGTVLSSGANVLSSKDSSMSVDEDMQVDTQTTAKDPDEHQAAVIADEAPIIRNENGEIIMEALDEEVVKQTRFEAGYEDLVSTMSKVELRSDSAIVSRHEKSCKSECLADQVKLPQSGRKTTARGKRRLPLRPLPIGDT